MPEPLSARLLAALPDDMVTGLFRYACEQLHEEAADILEAELARRGLYGRKQAGDA